jgi:hypothetical protein
MIEFTAEAPLVIKGTLFFWTETGIPGVYALQDERFISPPPKERWSYEGLFPLKTGDRLKVFNPDKTVYWEGTVELDDAGNPIGIDRVFWNFMFKQELQGEVAREE